ncbi:MAG: hypothetical protein PHW02_09515 [bacterium]|nr:hypothetical protein [bacterium]
MVFFAVFVVYFAAMAATLLKTKDAESFVSIASFIAGITQMVLLFVFFLVIFLGVKSSEFTVNADQMLLMYSLDFSTVLLFLFCLWLKSIKMKLTIGRWSVFKELIQLFLPVLILDLSIRILARYDLGEHSYVYVRISNQYLYAMFFKFIFAFSGFFTVKLLNSNIKRPL